MTEALAALAVVVAVAFTVALGERWTTYRRPHEAAWTISLGMFTVASLALLAGSAAGWNALTFRVFYLFGAILNVPWLALGSVLLVSNGKRARVWAAALALASAFVAGVVTVAPLRARVTGAELPEGRVVFGVLPRVSAAVGSGVAATTIVVLALVSARRLLRGGRRSGSNMPRRRLAVGNIVIALGTLVLSASGTIAGRLGQTDAFAITLAVGITVLFAGFVIATGSTRSHHRSPRRLAVELLTAAA